MIVTLNHTKTLFSDVETIIPYNDKVEEEKQHTGQNKTILRKIAKSAVAVPLISQLFAKGAFASSEVAPVMSDLAKQKIIHAFDPLIDLIISISFPVASVMLTAGGLIIMVGMKEVGSKLIMRGSIGYVLVQMMPLFLELLAGVGEAV